MSEMASLCSVGIRALRACISSNRLSHEAVVAKVFDHASANAAQHVFTRFYADAALAAARRADAALRTGVALPALAGLPVTVKDLFDVAGETTMAGSVVRTGEPAAIADATAVARLRCSGAAIIGKTNMTEFAFSGVGINPHYGTPRNPVDSVVDRIPGGSSSGTAVSVALGLAVAGLGSDTGGSIRIPAALCGLVGFKSTRLRVPRAGSLELARSLDTICALANNVEDCLIMDACIADAPLVVQRRSLQDMRFAVPRALMLDCIEAPVARAFQRVLTIVSNAGAVVVEVPLTELNEIAAINVPGGLASIEAAAVHRMLLATQPAAIDRRVLARLATGVAVAASDYILLQDQRRDWIARVGKALTGFDALLCPTVPIVAPAIQALATDDAFFAANGLLLRNTFAINFLDGCAFSLPCHRSGELPVGLMLSSVGGDDARLAAVAVAIEEVLRVQ